MQLRVIDLDGSLLLQPAISERLSEGRACLADFRHAGPHLRVLASQRRIAGFVAGLDRAFGRPGGDPEIFLYGSGDFHHLSAALISRLREPVTVVHFDNHPDWCRLPATFNCGGWVNRALDLPHVTRVVTIGPCSADFVRPEWQTANLPAVAAGRLEVYPWRAAPSKVWMRYPDTRCCRFADGAIHWRNLADEAWGDFLDELIARLPATALWITIDKDVLSPAEATTNWDQGQMPLDLVIAAVERLAANGRIAGIDVCGEHSPPVFAGWIRTAIANFDNPSGAAPSPEALAINAASNSRLLSAFERVLG